MTGNVVDVGDEGFSLDYGDGRITVEMDGWSWYATDERVEPGETVTVAGRIDDDLFESRTLEAQSVYVLDRNTYYFAGDAPAVVEHSILTPALTARTTVSDTARTTVHGTVESIDGRELTLETSEGEIQVDTATMPYDPIAPGQRGIYVGDSIWVAGKLERDTYGSEEILAETIVTLHRDETRESS